MFRKGNTEKMSAQKLVILAFFVALYIVLERFFSFNVWTALRPSGSSAPWRLIS